MKIHMMEQGSPEWFAARLGKVTGSNFSEAISKGVGKAPSKTRENLLYRLTYERANNKRIETYTNEHMKRGNELESEVREIYKAAEGYEVNQVGFIEHNEYIGVSPDGLINDDGVLEIKCPKPENHVKNFFKQDYHKGYAAQIQGLLWVTERKWCHFLTGNPEDTSRPIIPMLIERDEEYISDLANKIYAFVEDLKKAVEQYTAKQF